MTLDMANFSIGVIKPDIVACTVEYEKKHFKQLLETQPGRTSGINYSINWHFLSAREKQVQKSYFRGVLGGQRIEFLGYSRYSGTTFIKKLRINL